MPVGRATIRLNKDDMFLTVRATRIHCKALRFLLVLGRVNMTLFESQKGMRRIRS